MIEILVKLPFALSSLPNRVSSSATAMINFLNFSNNDQKFAMSGDIYSFILEMALRWGSWVVSIESVDGWAQTLVSSSSATCLINQHNKMGEK